MRPALRFATCLLLGSLWLGSVFGLDFERMKQSLMMRFGPAPIVLFNEWQNMLASTRGSEQDKLRAVNDFFNRRIVYDDDITIWGQSDYWATPLETIGRGKADCEDFSIAKYFSLIDLGVPVAKLRLVYVKAQVGTPGGNTPQAHMVLAYYPSPNADPYILDNLNAQILPASRRPDLSPVFSFNSAGIWRGTTNQSSNSNLSRWQDLLARARADGFE